MSQYIEFYETIKNQVYVSILIKKHITLSQKGKEYMGKCPFHNDKTPSFFVNDIKKFYHCFGCGAHGDVIKFVSEFKKLTYSDAAKEIANKFNIHVPQLYKKNAHIYQYKEQLIDILSSAAQFFYENANVLCRQYLHQRGLNQNTIHTFMIGYDTGKDLLNYLSRVKSFSISKVKEVGLIKDSRHGKQYQTFFNRIVFPIIDHTQKVVGFGARAIGDSSPKYLNSPESAIFKKNELLYGENIAFEHIRKKNYSILVEGYFDVLTLHQNECNNAVAVLGTAVSEMHLERLWSMGKEIVVALDSDVAGQNAEKKIIDMALKHLSSQKMISFVELEQSKDPDSMINNNADGKEQFLTQLHNRITLSEKIWSIEFNEMMLSNPEGKSILEFNLNGYCAKIQDKLFAMNFKSYFKNKIWHHVALRNRSKYQRAKIVYAIPDISQCDERTRLEYNICAFVIRFPEILSNNKYKNQLLNMHFITKNLHEFIIWCEENFVNNNHDREFLVANAQKSRFSKLFSLLSREDKFLDLDLCETNEDHKWNLYELLYNKHYLVGLKDEYQSMYADAQKDLCIQKCDAYNNEIKYTIQQISYIYSKLVK